MDRPRAFEHGCSAVAFIIGRGDAVFAEKPLPPPPARARTAPPLTSREIEALFTENARRIDAMDVAAGSLVKALMMELERRRTYLTLAEPEPGAHMIAYEVAQGDRREVLRLAKALGFEHAGDRLLEGRDA